MFILKKGHQPGVYVPLRALFLVNIKVHKINRISRLKSPNQITYLLSINVKMPNLLAAVS